MLNKAFINLSVLQKNALAVKAMLPSATRLCAVVKADGYGHGACKVASALYGIADCFAVALPEEGVELRYAGVDKPILVLTPVSVSEIRRAIDYRLTVTASSEGEIDEFESECEKCDGYMDFHVAYNTGMNRYGADGLAELQGILNRAKVCKRAKLSGFFSHYAAPENRRAFGRATAEFKKAVRLVKEYDKNVVCHISASGGFINGENFDMVRIGLLLYGYTPFKTDKISVKPIMRVYAPVVENRILPCFGRAMYGVKTNLVGGKFHLVRYGYADGLFRKRKGRLLRNRCMDVSAYKGEAQGSIAIMTDAEATAKENGTISYEVLVKVAARAEKIYVD